MRHGAVLLTVFATLAVVAWSTCSGPENDPDIPPGSYKNTCFGCRIEEETLVCGRCLDDYGRSTPASIGASACSEYANDNGRLVCAAVKATEAPLPEGSFTESCFGCKATKLPGGQRLLICDNCADSYDNPMSSILEVGYGCEPVVNRGGSLACGGVAARQRLEL